MKRRYGVIFAILGFVFFAIEAWAADWKLVVVDSDGACLYDTESVSRGQDVTSVWLKLILSDKGKAKRIKMAPEINGIENISYLIQRAEINCSKNAFRCMALTLYSSEGETILSGNPQEQFEEVRPGSLGDSLVKIICEKGERALPPSVVLGADWKKFFTAKDGSTYFYNTQSIVREGNTVWVWEKWLLIDKDKATFIKEYSKVPGIENISFNIEKEEIDCSRFLTRTTFFALYDSKGDVIFSGEPPKQPFEAVKPDSIGAALVEAVCKRGGGGK